MKVNASIESQSVNLAYHVDSIALADGDYQLILDTEEGYSEDPENFVREFSEGPNQSSDAINLTDPSPTNKGKPRCISQNFKLLQFHYYIIYLALRLGVEMKL
jgi:hypothetical protein